MVVNMSEKKKFKRQAIDYLLTDLLPVEKGMHFTHIYFYDYLDKEIKKYNSIVKIVRNKKQYFDSNWHSAPLSFKTQKKKVDFRNISLINPLGLMEALIFIELFSEELIGDFKSKDHFSLRHISHNNDLVYKTLDNKRVFYRAEEKDRKKQDKIMLEASSSFYKIKPFKTLPSYLNSDTYLEASERYDYLLKLDIQSFFHSIYTHSYKWTISNKTYDSKNLSSTNSLQRNIDTFLQNINGSKTNGILVGPEISRLLAEYLIVQLDNQLIDILYSKNIVYKQDYIIHRYVDDYYIYTNSLSLKEEILNELGSLLSHFQLVLKGEKMQLFETKKYYTNTWLIEITDIVGDILSKFEDSEKMMINTLDLIMNLHTNQPKYKGEPVSKEDLYNILKKETQLVTNNKRIPYRVIKNKTLALIDQTDESLLVPSYLLTVISSQVEDSIDNKIVIKEKDVKAIISLTVFLYSLNISYVSTQKVIRIFTLLLEHYESSSRDLIQYEIEKKLPDLEKSYIVDWIDLVLLISNYNMQFPVYFNESIIECGWKSENPIVISSLFIAIDSGFINNSLRKRKLRKILNEKIENVLTKINWDSFFEDELGWWVFLFYSYPKLNKYNKDFIQNKINGIHLSLERILKREIILKEYDEKIKGKSDEIKVVENKIKDAGNRKDREELVARQQELRLEKDDLTEVKKNEALLLKARKDFDVIETQLFILRFLQKEKRHFIEWEFSSKSYIEKFYFYTRKRTIFNPKISLNDIDINIFY